MPLGTKKTGFNSMIFIIVFLENCLLNNAIHDLSEWFRTDSNPADINWFRSHTEKLLKRFVDTMISDIINLNKIKHVNAFKASKY